jgi:hypothetical protein
MPEVVTPSEGGGDSRRGIVEWTVEQSRTIASIGRVKRAPAELAAPLPFCLT